MPRPAPDVPADRAVVVLNPGDEVTPETFTRVGWTIGRRASRWTPVSLRPRRHPVGSDDAVGLIDQVNRACPRAVNDLAVRAHVAAFATTRPCCCGRHRSGGRCLDSLHPAATVAARPLISNTDTPRRPSAPVAGVDVGYESDVCPTGVRGYRGGPMTGNGVVPCACKRHANRQIPVYAERHMWSTADGRSRGPPLRSVTSATCRSSRSRTCSRSRTSAHTGSTQCRPCPGSSSSGPTSSSCRTSDTADTCLRSTAWAGST